MAHNVGVFLQTENLHWSKWKKLEHLRSYRVLNLRSRGLWFEPHRRHVLCPGQGTSFIVLVQFRN